MGAVFVSGKLAVTPMGDRRPSPPVSRRRGKNGEHIEIRNSVHWNHVLLSEDLADASAIPLFQ